MKKLQTELNAAKKDRSCLQIEIEDLTSAKENFEKEIIELTKVKNRCSDGFCP